MRLPTLAAMTLAFGAPPSGAAEAEAPTGRPRPLIWSPALMLAQLEREVQNLTDVRADPRLAVVATIPDTAYEPIVYAATASRVGRSPSTRPFLNFLGTQDAERRLGAEGPART